MNKLAVLVNNEIVFEFDRDIIFEEQQLACLDRMDSDIRIIRDRPRFKQSITTSG